MAKRIDLLREQRKFLVEHNASAEEIAAIDEKIARSKRGRSSKNKGSSYERDVVAKSINTVLGHLGIDMRRCQQSGGAHKDLSHSMLRGDVVNYGDGEFPFHVEAKNHKTWSLKAWWKQADEECAEGNIPLVVFHQGQRIEGGKVVEKADDFVMLRFSDFLELVKQLLENGENNEIMGGRKIVELPRKEANRALKVNGKDFVRVSCVRQAERSIGGRKR